MLSVKKAGDVQKEDFQATFSAGWTASSPLEQISSFLDEESRETLVFAPWKKYRYKPEVQYAIAHSGESILLKFYIQEQLVLASHSKANDPVYKDSCVEFFISFDDKGYYNFEFNCIGTCLAAFGQGRNERTFLSEETINKIRCQSVITRGIKPNMVYWTLTLAIPLDVFTFHSLSSLSGKRCKVNFFKCGDRLPEPHYLAWKNIVSREPDFHLPEFFGTMVFR